MMLAKEKIFSSLICFSFLTLMVVTPTADALTLNASAEHTDYLPVNSLPRNFAGKWQCITQVTASQVPGVAVGSQMVSEIVFEPLADGSVVARWYQPGWQESGCKVKLLNSNSAQIERDCQYIAASQYAWTSQSQDLFTQVSEQQIVSSSRVNQYSAGQFLGQYCTRSLLVKVGS